VLATVLLSALLATAADLSEAAKKELKALEGEWTVVAYASDGKERDLPAEEQIAVSIKGAKFTFGKYGDAEVTALDPSLKPKIVDFKMLRKPESGATNEAIYKLEKDTLTVVLYLGEDKKRPDSFDIPKDGQTGRWILKRAK
jgi:uncharacterized protein (TIGR03067 family)